MEETPITPPFSYTQKSGNLFGKKSDESLNQMKELKLAEIQKNETQELQKKEEENITEVVTVIENETFSDKDLHKVWNDYIQSLNKGSLSFIKDRKLINENNKISVVFASNHEKSLCDEHRLNGVQYLRINLKNTQITLDFIVDASLTPEIKSLSVEDKFNKMVEINPDLASLRQLFELEIDY